MHPTFKSGQVVIGLKAKHAQPGDIVIFRHQGKEKLKRLKKIQSNRIYVIGDNVQASTDSTSFGWLPSSALLGVVIWPRRKKKQRI